MKNAIQTDNYHRTCVWCCVFYQNGSCIYAHTRCTLANSQDAARKGQCSKSAASRFEPEGENASTHYAYCYRLPVAPPFDSGGAQITCCSEPPRVPGTSHALRQALDITIKECGSKFHDVLARKGIPQLLSTLALRSPVRRGPLAPPKPWPPSASAFSGIFPTQRPTRMSLGCAARTDSVR